MMASHRFKCANKFTLLMFSLLVCILSITNGANFPSNNDLSLGRKYARGQGEVEKIHGMMKSSKLPYQESCWKSALESLQVSCNDMAEETQSRLAFAFTSCFTDMTGMGQYMCEESANIKDCFKSFDPAVMHIFHSYFLHTQDMCFYLNHELWQKETETAVNKLTTAAADVAESMKESKDTQSEILESQKEAVRVQAKILQDHDSLSTKVSGVKEIFEQFRISADEHRAMFFELFEKLSRMQKLVGWLQGEISLLDMMGYYFICLIFGFVSTSTKRTAQARFWLVILFVSALTLERYLFKILAEDSQKLSPEEIQAYIWLMRKGAAVCGLVMVLIAAAIYRDYNILNNNMLNLLGGRMDTIYKLLLEMKGGTRLESIAQEIETSVTEQEVEESPEDENLDSDTSSTTSYSNYSDETSDGPFDNIEEQSTVDPLAFVTPSFVGHFAGMVHSPVNGGVFCTPDSSVMLPKASHLPDVSTPEYKHPYNLRDRKSLAPPQNGIIPQETATEFARNLRKSRRISKAHYKVAREAANKYFSDDEEIL